MSSKSYHILLATPFVVSFFEVLEITGYTFFKDKLKFQVGLMVWGFIRICTSISSKIFKVLHFDHIYAVVRHIKLIFGWDGMLLSVRLY